MKTILLATDFTPAANNALVWAVKLARTLHAEILLYHAYVSEPYVPDFVILPPIENLQEEFEALLLKEVKRLPAEDRLLVKTRCEPGYAADAILKVSLEVDAALIIAGMKQNGRTYRKLFGSTIFPVYQKALVPVIVVPETTSYNSIRQIAFASDFEVKKNYSLLRPLIDLIKTFHAKLFVVSVAKEDDPVNENHSDIAYEQNLTLKDLSPEYHFIQHEDIDGTLEKFIDDKAIDMLAMVAHPHSFFERLFLKSNIQQLMFDGRVPLLVLPDRVVSM